MNTLVHQKSEMEWLKNFFRNPGHDIFYNDKEWRCYCRRGGCKQFMLIVDAMIAYYNRIEERRYGSREIIIKVYGEKIIDEHIAKCEQCRSDDLLQQIITKSIFKTEIFSKDISN